MHRRKVRGDDRRREKGGRTKLLEATSLIASYSDDDQYSAANLAILNCVGVAIHAISYGREKELVEIACAHFPELKELIGEAPQQ